MLKVHVQVTCSHCNGEAYQPVGEAEDSQGHKYIRHIPCPVCEGSGNQPQWVNLDDFAKLLYQSVPARAYILPRRHAFHHRWGMG